MKFKNLTPAFCLILLLPLLLFENQTQAQGTHSQLPEFEIFPVNPPLSISANQMESAMAIGDLNKHYKPSWVRTYYEVKLYAEIEGEKRIETGNNDQLTAAQKLLMQKAKNGEEIHIDIHYLPENNLVNNEPKNYTFSFTIHPEVPAKYEAGEDQLYAYLKKNAIEKIPPKLLQGYDMAAVSFSIDQEGKAVDANIFSSSKDLLIDELLLETIKNMPCWQAAKFQTGKKTKQDFLMVVGSMENCLLHTVNLDRN